METEDEGSAIPATYRDWREARGFRAGQLQEAGWSQVRIAEALGMTEGAFSQWFKQVPEGGH